MFQTKYSPIFVIFFLYMIFMSSNLQLILGCNLQKVLQNSIVFQHTLVFLSIFLFTYVLRWFVPFPGSITTAVTVENDIYIENALLNSFIIYVLFVLSTKQTTFHALIFFVTLLILVGLFIYYVMTLDKNNMDRDMLNKYFISKEDTSIESLVYLHNGITLLYVFFVANIFVGTYRYYLKQRQEHKNWDWVVFFLGNNKCKDL